MSGPYVYCRLVIVTISLLLVYLIFPIVADAADEQSATAADVTSPENLTQPEVRDLVSRLSDDQVRALLISQLDKVAAAQTVSEDGLSLEVSLSHLHGRAIDLWEAIPQLPRLGSFISDKLAEGRPGSNVWTILIALGIIIAGAAVAEWLFRRLFTRLGQLAHGGELNTTLNRLCIAGLRMMIELFAIGVFIVAASFIFFTVYDGHEPSSIAMSSVFWAVVLIRIIIAVAEPLLSPSDAAARLLPLDDKTARHGFRRLVLVSVMIIISIQFMVLLRKYGLEEGPMLAMGSGLTLVVLSAIIIILWRDRKTFAAMILPADAVNVSPARQLLAANWHVLASCYLLGLLLVSLIVGLLTGQSQRWPLIVSLCLLPGIPLVDWLARAGIRQLFEGSPMEENELEASAEAACVGASVDLDAIASDEEHTQKTQAETAREAFEPVLIRNIRVILGLLVFILLAETWGFDLHNVAASTVSERVADALFEIVVTLILAWAVWGFVKTAISYYAPQEAINVDQMIEGESGGTGLSRAQTLLPLFRKFILITLIVIVTLVVLSSLGVSIGPLIAGAGVVGLAIGFGAQALVRDIISGAFFLADDAFRIGEYIDVGVAKGMVERISVRSFRLRHHNGPINTIPFGEVQKVMNYSRDWVMMKLEMRVPSDTDLEKLRKIVKKVGQKMMEEPEFAANLLQPLKSQGVNRMEDDGAFLIRVKFMCKPGEQFVLRREVFRRVQEAFAANGIMFAPKRVMVDAGPGVSETQATAAAVTTEASPKKKPC